MSLAGVLVCFCVAYLSAADTAVVSTPWWNMTTSAPQNSSAEAMDARGAVIFTIVIICVYGMATVCLIASEHAGGGETDHEKQIQRYYQKLDYVECLAHKTQIKHRKSYYPAILSQAAPMKRKEIKEVEKRVVEPKRELVKQETAMALESLLNMYEEDKSPELPEVEYETEEPDLDYVGTLPSGEAVYETTAQAEGCDNVAFVRDDDVARPATGVQIVTPALELHRKAELLEPCTLKLRKDPEHLEL